MPTTGSRARPASDEALRYRPDLDGLRALAIVPVVLYHYGVPGVSGGFVGVDVFFVISGFLITALVLRDIAAGQFSIVRFYERRARRILPALFVVLGVTTALAVMVFLPVDLRNYGRSLVATATFASNLLFWREFGYFDRAAELKPLLHTWSLSVEEQFYIAFPLFLWLLAGWSRTRLNAVLASVLGVSLALSAAAAAPWPAADFYLPVTRAWELLMGALLASSAVRMIGSKPARDLLSLAGIALIAGSVILIDRGAGFPGWLAVVPCLGAALVIHSSLSGGGVGNRLLEWKPLVAVGLGSYSLYLWHWPLLVMTKYAANRELTTLDRAGVLVTTCALACMSWRYVERPFRGTRSLYGRRQVFQFAGLGSAVALVSGLAFIVSGGFPSRVPLDVLRYAQVTTEGPQMSPGCSGLRAVDVREGRLCAIGAALPPESASFVVWGDSHAGRLSIPLADVARSRGRVGLLASVGSCAPLLDVEWPVRGCGSFNEAVAELVERNAIPTVILAGMWANYAEGTRFRDGLGQGTVNLLSDRLSVHRTPDENSRVFVRALRRTVERLVRAGAQVVVIGPVPEIAAPVPEALAKAQWFGGAKRIGPSAADFRFRQRHVFEALAAVATVRNTTVIYPSTASCDVDCVVERSGQVLYVDDNHLSRAGLDLVKPLLERIFDVGETAQVVVRR